MPDSVADLHKIKRSVRFRLIFRKLEILRVLGKLKNQIKNCLVNLYVSFYFMPGIMDWLFAVDIDEVVNY